jgi:predicted lipid-binding transport protein (Tim44 family)
MDYALFIPIIGLLIPVVAILSMTINRFIRLREKQIEFAAGQAAEKAARYAANGAEIEQRVRILERIVTDRGIDLADEIERLRDDAPQLSRMRSN